MASISLEIVISAGGRSPATIWANAQRLMSVRARETRTLGTGSPVLPLTTTPATDAFAAGRAAGDAWSSNATSVILMIIAHHPLE
jgi:hypothetical protein